MFFWQNLIHIALLKCHFQSEKSFDILIYIDYYKRGNYLEKRFYFMLRCDTYEYETLVCVYL